MGLVPIITITIGGIAVSTNILVRNKTMHPTTQSRYFLTEAQMNQALQWLGMNLNAESYSVDKHETTGTIWQAAVWFKDVSDMLKWDQANIALYAQ